MIIGACSRCGGNLSQCVTEGCPSDPNRWAQVSAALRRMLELPPEPVDDRPDNFDVGWF